MNKSILLGRITKDIEVRKTANDISTCQFTIAVNRNYKNKDGNYDADFINCIAFRNTADFIGNYFKKGNRVLLEGRIQTRSYKDKQEQTRYVTEVVVENITLLEGKKQEEKEEIEVPQSKSNYDNDNTDIQLEDEDLPF